MNIMMVLPYLPYPTSSGGQIRSYNLIQNLSKKHNITLIGYIRDAKELENSKILNKYCNKIYTVTRRPAWSWKHILMSIFTPFPFLLLSTYYSPPLKRIISKELNQKKYDLIHCETFYVMPNLPRTRVPILLVEQTIEFLVYEKYVHDFKYFFLKPIMYLDILRLKLWEKYYWKRATRLATVSEDDREYILEHSNVKKINVIANGVDIDFFKKTKKTENKSPVVLFVGQFRWLPNREAALLLIKKIWPLIIKELPTAKLLIVGRNAPPEILKYTKEGEISIRSDIEDIRDAYGQADVILAPVMNGKGTKYKILEAMATHTPIVASPIAAEGLNIVNGKHALIATDETELAKNAIRVLKDKKLARNLEKNAFELLEQNYSWDTITLKVNDIYSELISNVFSGINHE